MTALVLLLSGVTLFLLFRSARPAGNKCLIGRPGHWPRKRSGRKGCCS